MSIFIEKFRKETTIGFAILSATNIFGISYFSNLYYQALHNLGIGFEASYLIRQLAGLVPALFCLYIGRVYLRKPAMSANILVILLSILGATSANLIGGTLIKNYGPTFSENNDPKIFERKDELTQENIQKSGFNLQNSAVYIVGPLEEEILFRFFVMGVVLLPFMGAVPSLIAGSVIFGFSHILAYNIDSIPSLIFSGILLGTVYLMYGLRYSMLLHVCINFMGILLTTAPYKNAIAHLNDHFLYGFSFLMAYFLPLCVFIFHMQKFIRNSVHEKNSLSGNDTGNI